VQSKEIIKLLARSGSLRIARDAAELLRPVMAIPGPINAPTSEGCHRLIGERAAEIVTSVTDAIELISAL
jgi:predicted Rossmann fold nucleotide-binding protein DprA/Smf involved in DNA uptake